MIQSAERKEFLPKISVSSKTVLQDEGKIKTIPDKNQENLLLANLLYKKFLPYKKNKVNLSDWNERTPESKLNPHEKIKSNSKM